MNYKKILSIALILCLCSSCGKIDLTKGKSDIEDSSSNVEATINTIQEELNEITTKLNSFEEKKEESETTTKKDYSDYSTKIKVSKERKEICGKIISLLEYSENFNNIKVEELKEAYSEDENYENIKTKNDLITFVVNKYIDDLIVNTVDTFDPDALFTLFGITENTTGLTKDVYKETLILNNLNTVLDTILNSYDMDLEENTDVEKPVEGKTYTYENITKILPEDITINLWNSKTASKASKTYTVEEWGEKEKTLSKKDYLVKAIDNETIDLLRVKKETKDTDEEDEETTETTIEDSSNENE